MASIPNFVSLNKTDSEDDPFNKEKFKQVLHYVISKCGTKPNVGKTVLYKLLYFSDFNYYETYETPMTGESYAKLPRGPAPIHFDFIIDELEEEDKIHHFIGDFMGYPQKKYKSTAPPNLSLLNDAEKIVVEKVLDTCSHMNATEISNYSHKDLPYRATGNSEIIDYELVFYRDPDFSVRE